MRTAHRLAFASLALVLGAATLAPLPGCGDSNRGNNVAMCPANCKKCNVDSTCGDCDPNVRGMCNGDTVIVCNSDGTFGEPKFCDVANNERCTNGACLSPCDVAASTHSYIGCDYWPTPLLNAQLDDMFDFAVVIANPETIGEGMTTGMSASVKVVAGNMPCKPDGNPDDAVQVTTVRSGETKVLILPWIYEVAQVAKDGVNQAGGSAQVEAGAYHLCSSLPVSVYQFNPLQFEKTIQKGTCPTPNDFFPTCHSYTNDASTLLPTATLGKEYMAISRGGNALQITPFGQPARAPTVTPGFFTIVATEDGTKVNITYSAYSESYNKGDMEEIFLNKGEVYEVTSARPKWDPKNPSKAPCVRGDMDFSGVYCDLGPDYDLTGTHIVADKPVALYGGHSCSFVPYNRWACDHLEDQIFPLATWGQHYLGAQTPPGTNGEPNLFRVISGANDNMITFGGLALPPITLQAGEWKEFVVNGAFEANSTGRMMVAQFMVGQNYNQLAARDGDPALGLVVPTEQYRKSYDFLTPDTYTHSYVTVIAKQGTSYTLDNMMMMMGFDTEVGSSGYGWVTTEVKPGPHRIYSDEPFGISVSGRSSFTSYLFPGGLNLNELDPG